MDVQEHLFKKTDFFSFSLIIKMAIWLRVFIICFTVSKNTCLIDFIVLYVCFICQKSFGQQHIGIMQFIIQSVMLFYSFLYIVILLFSIYIKLEEVKPMKYFRSVFRSDDFTCFLFSYACIICRLFSCNGSYGSSSVFSSLIGGYVYSFHKKKVIGQWKMMMKCLCYCWRQNRDTTVYTNYLRNT